MSARDDATAMVLTCPACATRYRVAEREFQGAVGRTVRCANCGHIWYETLPSQRKSDGPETPRKQAVSLASAPADSSEETTPTLFARIESSPHLHAPAPQPPRRRLTAAFWVIGIAVLLLAAAAAGLFITREFAALWPSAARFYNSMRHPGAVSETDLVIRKIVPSRTSQGLLINGEITNSGKEPHDVPRLRVALQDEAEKEIQFQIFDPPKSRLQPGETVAFATSFPHPSDAAAGVVVTFASH
jgi:predicted Zn finger-like uncharacterized protein